MKLQLTRRGVGEGEISPATRTGSITERGSTHLPPPPHQCVAAQPHPGVKVEASPCKLLKKENMAKSSSIYFGKTFHISKL